MPILEAPTQAEAAARVNVAERSVRSARAVIEHASAEVIRAVEQGKLAVSAAADLAKLPKIRMPCSPRPRRARATR